MKLLSRPTLTVSKYIRDFFVRMRYINLHFTYFLTESSGIQRRFTEIVTCFHTKYKSLRDGKLP